MIDLLHDWQNVHQQVSGSQALMHADEESI